jgi:hypothetical protein
MGKKENTDITIKMANKFITTESRSDRGVQHYVIKFVSDLQQVSGFLRVLSPVSSINKTDHHDITEILLKVALNTILSILFVYTSS